MSVPNTAEETAKDMALYDTSQLSPNEVIDLAAADGSFFAHYFLPKAFTLPSPTCHKDIWKIMEDPTVRYGAIEVFRDGAKTTLARAYTLKRVAFGLMRTGLIVSETKQHSQRTIDWLTRRVSYNKLLKHFFQIKLGSVSNVEEIEVYVGLFDIRVRLVAQGITGQLRGLNIDDMRPDFILGDDINNEENTATPEQREKISNLFFGALYNSLQARSLNEHSKMLLLQTGLHAGDVLHMCHRSA